MNCWNHAVVCPYTNWLAHWLLKVSRCAYYLILLAEPPHKGHRLFINLLSIVWTSWNCVSCKILAYWARIQWISEIKPADDMIIRKNRIVCLRVMLQE